MWMNIRIFIHCVQIQIKNVLLYYYYFFLSQRNRKQQFLLRDAVLVKGAQLVSVILGSPLIQVTEMLHG